MANEFKIKKGLIIKGSGNTPLDIIGDQGQLFSVTDNLIGDIFSVNDISGLPILTVNSEDKVTMGTFGTNALVVNGTNVGIGTATPSQKLDVVGKIALNDGGNSVYIGTDAGLNDDASDNRNVGVGHQSLLSNTTGFNNTANGSYSLYANTTGGSNTANGYASLYFNTTGNNNTANGYASLRSNTTGGSNTANGYASLYSNTTGNNNTANGFYSLYSNTTGNSNTANGFYSLRSNTTGGSNTATGRDSLYANTTGFNNIANGVNSGRYISDGTTENTITNNSVFLGVSTKALADNQTNQIVIGYAATGLGSNTAVLGNDSIVTTALKGNVGIGTTSPTFKLNVKSSTGDDGISLSATTGRKGVELLLDSGVNGGGDIKMYTGNSVLTNRINAQGSSYINGGNVGIGTTTPTQKLHVVGNIQVEGSFYDSNNDSGLNRQILSSTSVGTDWASLSDLNIVEASGTAGYIPKFDSSTMLFDSLIYDSGTGIGIGISNPLEKLEVDGNLIIGDSFNSVTYIKTGLGGYNLAQYDPNNYEFSYGDGALKCLTANGIITLSPDGFFERMRIDSQGNVGIGTTNPSEKLDVEGDVLINGIIVGAGRGNINNNTTVGKDAFGSNSSGQQNVAVGESTLSQADASFNTAIGAGAGSSISTGNGNIVIGSLDRNGNYVPAYDITSDDDHISMGTTTTQRAYINVSWDVLSDARYKTEFNEIPHGLDFVKQLNPISYKLRKNKDTEETIGDKSYGFKAQDILALEGDNPVIINNSKEDRLTYKESNLIPILVKAIQEQQTQIEELKELLKQQINR